MNKIINKKRVVVAMSGGVDSSVTAALLHEQGFDVIGCTMHLADYTENENTNAKFDSCCSPRDVMDAKKVCEQLGIPHYVLNMKSIFKETVIDHFIQEYREGRTPIPCIQCNKEVKFKHLLHKTKLLGGDYLATGHYAKIRYDEETNLYRVYRASDLGKDQTYFLFGLTQEELAYILFPLSDLNKEEVRSIAEKYRLGVAKKRDSYEICFVQSGRYSDYIQKRLPSPSSRGNVVDMNGKKVAEHGGLFNFTIGQRKGIGSHSSLKPYYVVKLDKEKNEVVVGENDQLLHTKLIADRPSWVKPLDLSCGLVVNAKIRYQHQGTPARLSILDDLHISVEFDQPVRAITPGQAVVFYLGDELIGGAWIQKEVKENATCQLLK